MKSLCSMEIDRNIEDLCVGGAVVVVAKCPIAGVSKTRLAPLLGAEGAALLAQAMLSDILVSLSECPLLRRTLKVLLYAPDTKSGESQMGVILQSLNLPYVNSSNVQQIGREPSGWVLLPMKSTESKGVNCVSDLTSSSLGGKLADALERTRELIKMTKRCTNPSANSNANEAVLFLGMDSPELPMEEVVYGLQISSGENRVSLQRLHDEVRNHKSEHICIDNAGVETYGRAHFCPAGDGGYGLISIPKHAPSSKIFSGVRWSQSLTAVSQLKALTDSNVDVSIGKLMHDVDEPRDVHDLVKRLVLLHSRNEDTKKNKNRKSQARDILNSLSSGSSVTISTALPRPFPRHTRKVLVDMNLIQDDSAS